MIDIPPLEDAFEYTEVKVEVPSPIEEIVIEVPRPYAFTNNKVVPWFYDMDIDLITRFGHTYAQANAQPPMPVANEVAKEFLAVIKASEYNVIDQLRKLPNQISLLEHL